MSTRTALLLAVLLLAVGSVLGFFWPQIWVAITLFVAPLLTIPKHKPPPREVPDDSDAVELEQDAANSTVRLRAIRRGAKRSLTELRKRRGEPGGRPDGDGDGLQ